MSKFERNLKYIKDSHSSAERTFNEVDPLMLQIIMYGIKQPFNVFRMSAAIIQLGCYSRDVSSVFSDWFRPGNYTDEGLQIFGALRSAVNSMCIWAENKGNKSPVRVMVDRLNHVADVCDKVLDNVIYDYYADERAGVTYKPNDKVECVKKLTAASEWFDLSFKELIGIADTFQASNVWPEYLHVVHSVMDVYMTADAKFSGKSWCNRDLSIAVACGRFCLNEKMFNRLVKQRRNIMIDMSKKKRSFEEIVSGIRKDYKAGHGWNWMAHKYGVHHRVAMAIVNPNLPVETWPMQKMIDSCAKVGASREEIMRAIPIILPKDLDYYNIVNRDTTIEEPRVVKGTRADFTLKQTMGTIIGSEDLYVDYRKVRAGLEIVRHLLERKTNFDSLSKFVDERGVNYFHISDELPEKPIHHAVSEFYDPTLEDVITAYLFKNPALGKAYLYNAEGDLIKDLFDLIIEGKISLKALSAFTLMNDKQ